MGVVLLINFGEAYSEAAVSALADAGLRAQVCLSGPQAFRWLRLKSVGMVWVVLPMTGIEDALLLHRLRRTNPKVHIGLLVERDLTPPQRLRLRALGAKIVLRSGIHASLLAQATRGLLT
jgi:DNA-binding NarL/FixJ family response regulator